MALSFIGKPISLISHSDVRYRGILAGIDPAASTIQLSRVYSMGTESRRPPADFIPPVQEPYEYIIFRASEVKDLAVDEPTPSRSVHDDPAVLGASLTPAPAPVQSYPHAAASPNMPYAQQQQQRVAGVAPAQVPPQAANVAAVANNNGAATRNQPPRRANGNNNVNTALETVERALGDLRVSNNSAPRGGRRGGVGGAPKPSQISVPTTDFDFQSSNARFDKKSGETGMPKKEKDDEVETNPSENGDGEGDEKDKGKVKESVAYNPQKSFFDELTPGPANEPRGNAGGRGRRGGMGGRNRREEEREKNVATFGEPGGVGLMGPGAYVGGWGGYGRRGGGRGGHGGRRGRGMPPAAVGVGARS